MCVEGIRSFPGKEVGNPITGWWALIRDIHTVEGSVGVRRRERV